METPKAPFPIFLIFGITAVILSTIALVIILVRKNLRKPKAAGAGKMVVPDTMSTYTTNTSINHTTSN